MLKRIISLGLIISSILLFTGCKNLETGVVQVKPQTSNVSISQTETKDEEVDVNPEVDIDTSNIQKGIVTVKYLNTVKGVRIYLLHNYESCAGYDIQDTSKDTVISLTNGTGTYYIEVAINDGNTETIIETKSFEAKKVDEFLPYLQSTYAVYYTEEMTVIKDAKKYTEGIHDVVEKIQRIKGFTIENLDYVKDNEKDYSKWAYFPNSDEIYREKKGVCTDFATMFAAICRSQNIPCKVVTGYAGSTEELHVWVEVFNGLSWEIIDLTLEEAVYTYPNCIIIPPSSYQAITVD